MDHDRGNDTGSGNNSDVDNTATKPADEPLSSLPFTCCIKEYGVKCNHGFDGANTQENSDTEQNAIAKDIGCSRPDCFGWERRFAIHGTTIY